MTRLFGQKSRSSSVCVKTSKDMMGSSPSRSVKPYSAVPKSLKRKSFQIVRDLIARYSIPLLTDRLTHRAVEQNL